MGSQMKVGHKLILALNELCNETFSISDDTILDKLFSFIESSPAVLEHCSLKEIAEWLNKVVSAWNKNELTSEVKHFSIRFFGLLGSSPEGFGILRKNVLHHILMLTIEDTDDYESRFVTSLINCIGMLSKHGEGWEWIIKTGIWKFAIKSCYCDKSVYINRAAKKLMTLLICSDLENGKRCYLDFFGAICDPLMKNQFQILSIDLLVIEEDFSSEEDQQKDKKLPPTSRNTTTRKRKHNVEDQVPDMKRIVRASKLLSEILEDLLLANVCILVKLNLKKDCFLKSCSQSSSEILLIISNLALLVELCYQMTAKEYCISQVASTEYGMHRACPFKEVQENVTWTIDQMCDLGSYNALVQYFTKALSWCKKFKHWCKPLCSTCSAIEGVIVGCLRCFLELIIYPHGDQKYELHTYELAVANQRSIRSVYLSDSIAFRFSKRLDDCKIMAADPASQDLYYITIGLPGLKRILKLISRSNKADILRDTIFALSLIVPRQENDGWLDSEVKVVLDLLSLSNDILEEYCPVELESITLAGRPLFLLSLIMKSRSWAECRDIRITVAFLQVIGTLLKRLFYPFITNKNLIAEEQLLGQLNTLTISLLSHKNWEVRDSTLELMQSIIDCVCLVPWTLNHIEKDALMIKTILRLVTDKESDEVRASALRFFSTAVRRKYFATSGYPNNLFDIGIKVLSEDQMPSVRRAACDLITALYINYVPAVLKVEEKMYDVLFEVSAKDMDWEVKKASLSFWQCSIDKLLVNKMSACLVSPYMNPFEVEDNKTVEIMEIFTKLGKIGCFQAIWIGLNDDCDISVSQGAKDVLINLEKLVSQFNLLNIINIDSDDNAVGDENEDKTKQLAPKEFFKRLSNVQWKQALNARVQWVESDCDGIDSMLDLILTKDNKMSDLDYNAVDCY